MSQCHNVDRRQYLAEFLSLTEHDPILLIAQSEAFSTLNLFITPQYKLFLTAKPVSHTTTQQNTSVLELPLSRIHPLPHNPLHRLPHLLLPIQQIHPRIPHPLTRQQLIRHLRHTLPTHLPRRSPRLPQLHPPTPLLIRQRARTEVNPHESRAALLGDRVECMVGRDFGFEVVRQDVGVELRGGGPLGVGPPRGLCVAGGEVGDEEEAGYGGGRGGGADEVDCGVAVDGVGLDGLVTYR